jgi:hypothetical protein
MINNPSSQNNQHKRKHTHIKLIVTIHSRTTSLPTPLPTTAAVPVPDQNHLPVNLVIITTTINNNIIRDNSNTTTNHNNSATSTSFPHRPKTPILSQLPTKTLLSLLTMPISPQRQVSGVDLQRQLQQQLHTVTSNNLDFHHVRLIATTSMISLLQLVRLNQVRTVYMHCHIPQKSNSNNNKNQEMANSCRQLILPTTPPTLTPTLITILLAPILFSIVKDQSVMIGYKRQLPLLLFHRRLLLRHFAQTVRGDK